MQAETDLALVYLACSQARSEIAAGHSAEELMRNVWLPVYKKICQAADSTPHAEIMEGFSNTDAKLPRIPGKP